MISTLTVAETDSGVDGAFELDLPVDVAAGCVESSPLDPLAPLGPPEPLVEPLVVRELVTLTIDAGGSSTVVVISLTDDMIVTVSATFFVLEFGTIVLAGESSAIRCGATLFCLDASAHQKV